MKRVILFTICYSLFASYGQGSGTSLTFDGIDDYVNFQNVSTWNSTFSGPGKEFTFETWVRPAPTTNQQQFILAKLGDNSCPSGSEDNRQLAFFLDDQFRPSFLFYSKRNLTLNYRLVSSQESVVVGEWVHLSVVYRADVATGNGLDRVEIYLNGEGTNTLLVAAVGPLGDIPAADAPLSIGSRVSATGQRCEDGPYEFVGTIDEVRIWSRALSQDEILNKMTERLAGAAPGLVAYYRMDEGMDDTCPGGQDVCDASGNNNHGVKF
ncbi:MAG: LamG domain-containing protein [Bacteroidetes bacterium]|jgi:hypothetical protein|nr:LamG domain-containing protein [Bacteroidota bacterium]